MSVVQAPVGARRTALLRVSAIRALPALALGVALWAALFLPEIRAAVQTWNASTAYGHCYLVLPMALYLVWERRARVAATAVRPDWRIALLALPVGLAWVFAERLGIMEGRQLVAVAGLELLIAAVLGLDMLRAIAGPVLYLFFLVPFGMFLTPALQHFTARFTAFGLDLIGIPNYADDLVIEIPAGTFLVAEACAGLRFLIASFAFGVFYALLNYRSPVRRCAFILASLAVPVVANGFRALGIVVLGHILGSAEAATADHIIYGWVFFSAVMLLLVLAGLPMREAAVAESENWPLATGRVGPGAVWAAVTACVLLAIGPAASRVLDMRASPVALAGVPTLTLPAGCSLAGDQPTAPAAVTTFHIDCGSFPFDVRVQAYPVRSTSAAMNADRLRLSGELSAEDLTFTAVQSADGANWLLSRAYDPFHATAIASWVDGAPAGGGLMARFRQARDSIVGASHAPVMVTVTVPYAEPRPREWQRAAVAALQKLVEAQDNLTPQIAALSRVP